jgi:hypothetical protein
LRLAGSIVLDALAFVVLDVGTRSPRGLLRDLGANLHNRRSLFLGAVRALVGLIFITAATVLLLPAIAVPSIDFLPVELFTLFVALAIEHLIGNDLRSLAGMRDH